jgi:hypothetical protein
MSPATRRDVANEIEIEPFIECRVDGVRHADEEQRVSIRGRSCDRLGADIRTRSRSVLDNEWLTQTLGQPLAH